jgi:CXCXC repeat
VFARARAVHQGDLYVIRSYGTPIGWAGPGELLTVPQVTYSVTTSRHQGIARRVRDEETCSCTVEWHQVWHPRTPADTL